MVPVVLLNGVEQTQVIMADEERCEVERNKTDDHGKTFIENRDVATELLTGNVKICWASK